MAKSLLAFASLPYTPQRGLCAAKIATVVSDDRKAIASKPCSNRSADAFAGARDENGAAHDGTRSLVLAKRVASSLGLYTVSCALATGLSSPKR